MNAIGELYDRHQTRIFRYMWSRVRDEQVAEDLTSEVFARMVSGLPRYRVKGIPFQAWLYRIAHNLTVDHYRKTSRYEQVSLDRAEEPSEEGSDPSEIVERRLALEQVQHTLNELDPLQQEVIVLRFLIGLPLRQVAQALGKTVASIKSLQHRGLVALRAELKSKGAW